MRFTRFCFIRSPSYKQANDFGLGLTVTDDERGESEGHRAVHMVENVCQGLREFNV